ncbi:MAG: flavin reductase family protein [Candidatus Promineifilaceae bacterium]|nr:flavin reductase family protein [Candidatus Promineifilaceae bacterium]
MPNDAIKDALKLMPYGFYSVTSRAGDDVNAMVANWLTQVSFDPRRVALGLQKTCYTHGLVEKSGVFALNIFHEDDEELLMPFTKGRSKRPDKMDEAEFTPAPETGCPILDGAAAYLEFKVVEIVDFGGDHDIILAEPVGAGVLNEDVEVEEILTLPKLGWSYAG